MLKQSYSPYGYKKLLVYKKAEELQKECSLLTSYFPRFSSSTLSSPSVPSTLSTPSSPSVPLKTILDLADQMNRSARSAKQNIVEGWKRNSTSEYHEFLGFSVAANAELEEDCDDIIKRVYPELMGIKGIMGERGERGGRGGRGGRETLLSLSTPSAPSTPSSHFSPSISSNPLTPSSPFSLSEVEKLSFYPLDHHLPPIVQLKLRAKELNYLLSQLQKSLEQKMAEEKTITAGGKLKMMAAENNKQKKFEEELRKKYNLKSPYDC